MLEFADRIIKLFEQGDLGYTVVGALITLFLLWILNGAVNLARSASKGSADVARSFTDGMSTLLGQIENLTKILDERIKAMSEAVSTDAVGQRNAQTLGRIETQLPFVPQATVEALMPRLDTLEGNIIDELHQIRDELKKLGGDSGEGICVDGTGDPAALPGKPGNPAGEGAGPLPGETLARVQGECP